MSEWCRFPGTAELDQALARHLALRLATDIDHCGGASLAVSGGRTPVGVFRQLAAETLAWHRVSLTLVDERCVATSSSDSNERLVRDNLLQGNAASAHFTGLAGTGMNDLSALEDQIAALRRPFTAVVLGMGKDGHTASWFPQAANLVELLDPAGTRLVALTDPVTAPHRRLTLTMPAVLDCREIIIHITGEDKRAVIDCATKQGYPIAAVLNQQTTPVSIWWAP
jgi:6-phosphogluconolactonase